MAKYIRIREGSGVDPRDIVSYRHEHQEPNPPVMWLHTTNGDIDVGSAYVPQVHAYLESKTTDVDLMPTTFCRRYTTDQIRRLATWLTIHLSRKTNTTN